MGRHNHPKTDVVVPVVRVVPVTVRTAHVPLIIVERAAAQDTHNVYGLPRQNIWHKDYIRFRFLRQPPSNLPISSSMRETCSY